MGWLGTWWGEQEGGEVGGLKFPLLFPFTPSPCPFSLAPTSCCFYYCKLLCNLANFFFISPCSQHWAKTAIRLCKG